jgi:multiple sugar transport system substrate-binding protein
MTKPGASRRAIVGKYAAGPWPSAPGVSPRNSFGGWVVGLPAQISPERAEIAWRFVRWYTSAPVERLLIENGNIDFPRISLIRDPELQQAHPVFKTVLELVDQDAFKAWIRAPVPEFVALADSLGTTMQDMLIDAMTPQEACDKVQEDMIAVLKKSGKLT